MTRIASESVDLLHGAAPGDTEAVNGLFTCYRDRGADGVRVANPKRRSPHSINQSGVEPPHSI